MSDDFAARCTACHFTWNTPAMAEGLRVIGSCPKCGGTLEYGALEGAPPADAPAAPVPAEAPHMVLGIPRI